MQCTPRQVQYFLYGGESIGQEERIARAETQESLDKMQSNFRNIFPEYDDPAVIEMQDKAKCEREVETGAMVLDIATALANKRKKGGANGK